MHIVFVTSVASKNVNEKIKTQTSSPPFVGGYMDETRGYLAPLGLKEVHVILFSIHCYCCAKGQYLYHSDGNRYQCKEAGQAAL